MKILPKPNEQIFPLGYIFGLYSIGKLNLDAGRPIPHTKILEQNLYYNKITEIASQL